MSDKLKILFKIPSRGRPVRLFEALDSLYSNIADIDNSHVGLTIDLDDESMNNGNVIARLGQYSNLTIQVGYSKNKIDAINRDIPGYPFDILVLFSDDMRITFYGFDEIIRNSFSDGLDWHVHYPDLDEGDKLPVLYVAGRDFFNRFGWIYNPIYQSLFCDTDLMHVAKKLGRYKYENIPGLFKHLLPAYGHSEPDQQWLDQQQIGWTVDFETFKQRELMGFDL